MVTKSLNARIKKKSFVVTLVAELIVDLLVLAHVGGHGGSWWRVWVWVNGLAGLAMAVGYARRNGHRDPIPVVTVGPEKMEGKTKISFRII